MVGYLQMPRQIQAKGLQHIRNLRKVADKLHKDLGGSPGLHLDCINAALLEHRIKCIKEERRLLEEIIESGNPS